MYTLFWKRNDERKPSSPQSASKPRTIKDPRTDVRMMKLKSVAPTERTMITESAAPCRPLVATAAIPAARSWSGK